MVNAQKNICTNLAGCLQIDALLTDHVVTTIGVSAVSQFTRILTVPFPRLGGTLLNAHLQ